MGGGEKYPMPEYPARYQQSSSAESSALGKSVSESSVGPGRDDEAWGKRAFSERESEHEHDRDYRLSERPIFSEPQPTHQPHGTFPSELDEQAAKPSVEPYIIPVFEDKALASIKQENAMHAMFKRTHPATDTSAAQDRFYTAA